MGSKTKPTNETVGTEKTIEESRTFETGCESSLSKIVSVIDSFKQTMLTTLFRADGDEAVAFGLFGLSVAQLIPLAAELSVALPALLPMQTTQLGEDLCQAGVGDIITIGLFVLTLILVYKSIPDLYRGIEAQGSASSGAQKQKSQHFSNAATKLIGAVVLGMMPTFLSTMGFTLLSCVDSVKIL